jgi:4-oxalocrotonate tautomerase
MVAETWLISAAALKLPLSTTRTNISMPASLFMIENPWVSYGSNHCMFINTGAGRNMAALPRSEALHLEMHPGRTVEQKRAFVREVTKVTAQTLACPPESVDILISEIPRDAWAKAGKLLADA